jgi:hypothetical protein
MRLISVTVVTLLAGVRGLCPNGVITQLSGTTGTITDGSGADDYTTRPFLREGEGTYNIPFLATDAPYGPYVPATGDYGGFPSNGYMYGNKDRPAVNWKTFNFGSTAPGFKVNAPGWKLSDTRNNDYDMCAEAYCFTFNAAATEANYPYCAGITKPSTCYEDNMNCAWDINIDIDANGPGKLIFTVNQLHIEPLFESLIVYEGMPQVNAQTLEVTASAAQQQQLNCVDAGSCLERSYFAQEVFGVSYSVPQSPGLFFRPDGVGTTQAPIIGTGWTGAPVTHTVPSNRAFIKFTSDSVAMYPGFSIDYVFEPLLCQPGYYMPIVVRQSVANTDLSEDCNSCNSLCNDGTVPCFEAGGVGDVVPGRPVECAECRLGHYGTEQTFVSDTCSGPCPAGSECPPPSTGGTPCSPGTYATEGQSSCSTCLEGYYCITGSTTAKGEVAQAGGALSPPAACNAGQYGVAGATSAECTGPCSAGYYCPAGSSSPTAVECATAIGGGAPLLNEVYCPDGSDLPLPVPAGYYSTGGTSATRHAIAQCPPGSYCSAGVQTLCDEGFYNANSGSSSSAACTACDDGYRCGEGSTSAQQNLCPPVNALYQAIYYCQAGIQYQLDNTACESDVNTACLEYTTPLDAPVNVRTGMATLEPGSSLIVVQGELKVDLEWPQSSGCSLVGGSGESRNMDEGAAGQLASAPVLANATRPIQYRVKQNSASSPFLTVATQTGLISSIAPIDYEGSNMNAQKTLDIVVEAYTDYSAIDCLVTINVQDVNEAPAFVESPNPGWNTRTVVEGAKRNTPIGDVAFVQDPDEGDELEYSMDDPVYDISKCSGQFVVKANTVEYDPQQTSSTVSVNVTDKGGLTDTAVFTITVTDANDRPVFATPMFQMEINENSAAETSVKFRAGGGGASGTAVIPCTDEEDDALVPSQPLTYTLQDTSGFFEILNSGVPVISLKSNVLLDYEALPLDNSMLPSLAKYLTVTITATDSGAPDNNPLFASASVQIEVIDVNDRPVVQNAIRYLPENSNSADPGVVQTLSSTTPAPVTGTDEDLTLNPAQTALIPRDTLTYSIKDVTFGAQTGVAASLTSGNFTIDPTTGQIKAAPNAVLDYEGQRTHLVHVYATDNGAANGYAPNLPSEGPTGVVSIELTNVNEPPTVVPGQEYPVDEDVVGAFANVQATDPDGGQQLSYFLEAIDGQACPCAQMSIEQTTGAISTLMVLDFETKTTYQLSVKVRDTSSPSLESATVPITINVENVNEPPTVAATIAADVPEMCSVQGCSSAGDVVLAGGYATDDDANDQNQLTYAFSSNAQVNLCGAVGSGTNPCFVIDAQTGQVTIADDVLLNYEGVNTYQFEIRVRDQAQATGVTTVTVTLQDVNEPAELFYARQEKALLPNVTFAVNEQSAAQVIGTFSSCDPDTNNELSVSQQVCISCGLTTGSPYGGIEVTKTSISSTEANCGTLWVLQVALTSQFPSWEQIPTQQRTNGFTVDVSITDGDPASNPNLLGVAQTTTAKLILMPINGNSAPVAQDATFSLSEAAPYGTVIGTVGVIDTDSDDVHDFTLVAPVRGIALGFNTGVLTVNEDLSACIVRCECEIDYDCAQPPMGSGATAHQLQLEVRITDSAGAKSVNDAVITINVEDVTEPPYFQADMFTTDFQVSEGSFAGTVVTGSPFVAIDEDPTRTVSYTLEPGSNDDKFDIGSSSGILTVKADAILDYESAPTLSITVVASAGSGGGQQTAQRTFTVNVLNVNEPPIIGEDVSNGDPIVNIPATIAENALMNSVDGQVFIRDILLNDDGDAFDIDVFIEPTPIVVMGQSTTMERVFSVDVEGRIAKLRLEPKSVSIAQTQVQDAFLNFEAQGSRDEVVNGINIILNATDSEGKSSARTVHLDVTDVPDVTVLNVTVTGSTGLLPTSSNFVTVLIGGTNFGTLASSGLPAPTTPTVEYGAFDDASNDFESGAKFVATDCTVTERYYQIECTSGAGTGNNLRWRVCIGTACGVSSFGVTSSYDQPRITSVNNAFTMSTSENTEITVVGENFGSTTSNVQVSYVSLNSTSGVSATASACSVLAPVSGQAEKIECTILGGAGSHLAFTVFAQGQASASHISASTTPYAFAKPEIISISSNVTELSTNGGDTVTIAGTSFGPIGTPVGAWIGSTPSPLCTLTTATTPQAMTCLVPPGVGQGYRWRVSIAGQVSEESAQTSTYEGPRIDSISGPGANSGSTRGNLQIVVDGEGFGPSAGSVGRVFLRYGSQASFTTNSPEFEATDCYVSVEDVQLTCTSGPGTGTNLFWQVTAGTGAVERTSNLFDGQGTGYGVPVLYTIEDGEGKAIVDGDTAGGNQVVITGNNFGEAARTNPIDPSSITYGPCVQETTDAVSGSVECAKRMYTASACEVTVDHTSIVCNLGVGSGANSAWLVYVAGQRSAAPSTSYGPPTISTVTVSGDGTMDTRGGTSFELQGNNFGTQDMLQFVKYGPTGVEFDATSTCTGVSHTSATCRAVAGYGANLKVTMRVGPRGNDTSAGQTSPLSSDTISYTDPKVTSVSPCAWRSPADTCGGQDSGYSTSGGSMLFINGSNFGPQGEVQIRMAGQLYQPATPHYVGTGGEDQSIEFAIPEGCGDSNIEVVVGSDQSSAEQVTFKYDTPRITNIVRSDSGNGAALTIFGRNFGSQALACATVFVAPPNGVSAGGLTYGTPVQVSTGSYSHTEISVLLPSGSGGQVHVEVDGVTSNTAEFSDFSPAIMTYSGDNTQCLDATARMNPACAFYKWNDQLGNSPAGQPPNSGGNPDENPTEVLTLKGKYFAPNPQVTIGTWADDAQHDANACIRVPDTPLYCEEGVCRDCTAAEAGTAACSTDYDGVPGSAAPRPLTYSRCDVVTGVCEDCTSNNLFATLADGSSNPGYDPTRKCQPEIYQVKCKVPPGQGAMNAIVVTTSSNPPRASIPVFMTYASPELDAPTVAMLSNVPTTGITSAVFHGLNFGVLDGRNTPSIVVDIQTQTGQSWTYDAALCSANQFCLSGEQIISQNESTVVLDLPKGQGTALQITFAVPSLYCPGELGDQFAATTCPIPAPERYASRTYSLTWGAPVLKRIELNNDIAHVTPNSTIVSDRRLQGTQPIFIYGDNFGENIATVQVFMSTQDVPEKECVVDSLSETLGGDVGFGAYRIGSYACAADLANSVGANIYIKVDGVAALFSTPTMETGSQVQIISPPAASSSGLLPTSGGAVIELSGTAFDNVQQGPSSSDVTIGANACANETLCLQAVNNPCTNSKTAGTFFAGKCWNLCTDVEVFKKTQYASFTKDASGQCLTACCDTKEEQCSVRCSVPPGQGTDQEVTVKSGDFRSGSLLISYAPPVMTWQLGATVQSVQSGVDCLLCPTTLSQAQKFGISDVSLNQIYRPPTTGVTLNLFGTNLGGFGGELRMFKNGLPHHESVPLQNTPGGEYITADIPAGTGSGYVLQYSVGGQDANVTTEFSYMSPNVTSTNPETADTDGSTLLTVIGSNFGTVPSDVQVKIGTCSDGACLCDVTSVTHTEIVCQVPVWQGKDLPVVVTVKGQNSTDDQGSQFKFSFSPPEVFNIVLAANATGFTPSDTCANEVSVFTSGGDDGAYITLEGRNFGSSGFIQVGSCYEKPYAFERQQICPRADSRNCCVRKRDCPAASLDNCLNTAGGTANNPSCRISGSACVPVEDSDDLLCRNCDCEHTTNTIKFQLPADNGFGGKRAVSIDIGGVQNDDLAASIFASGGACSEKVFVSYTAPAVDALAGPSQLITTDGKERDSLNNPTDTNYRITITGTSFGKQYNTWTAPSPGAESTCDTYPLDQSSPPMQYSAEVRLYQPVVTEFDPSQPCLGGSYTGLIQPNCSLCQVVEQSQNKIVCEPGPGYGVGLQIKVVMKPPALDAVTDPCADYDCAISTGSATVNYAPPSISSIFPSTFDAMGGQALTLVGDNFGAVSTAATVRIADGDTTLECSNALWTEVQGQKPRITCTSPPNMRAGPKSFELDVATQSTSLPMPTVNETCAIAVCPRAECQVGYYGNSDETDASPLEYCTKCDPASMICEVNNLKQPEAQPGWWRQDVGLFTQNGGDKYSEYGCDANTHDRESCDVYLPCEPKDSCQALNVCKKGYQGERCAVCATDSEGYPTFFKLSGECVPCPACSYCVLLVFIGLAAGAASLCYVFTKKKIALGIFSIGFDYFQVLAVLASGNRITWPSQVMAVFQLFSAANFNLDLMAPECSFPSMSYTRKWISIECLPLVALFTFICMHFAKYAHKRWVQGRTKKLHNHRHMVIGMSLTAMYYLYLYMTKVSLDIFNCSPTDPPDGNEYLEAVFESCSKKGGVHQTLLPWAIIFFCAYTLGYPAVVALILFKNQERVKEDQLLRANNTGDSRDTNPNCHDFRKRYSRLYFHFKPHHFYWILIILARKFLIATASLVFRKTPVFLLAFILLIIFVAYALQVRHQPYMSMSERPAVVAKYEAEREGHDVSIFKSKSKQQRKRGREKIRFGEKITREKAEATAEYFWNYNTVEAVLLFCAFMIVLMGLMFNSDGFEKDSAAETSTVAFTLFVLIFSILYFIAVLVSELVIGLDVCQGLCRKKLDKFATKLNEGQGDNQEGERDPMARHGSEIEFNTNALLSKRASTNPVASKAGQDAMRELGTAHETIEQLQSEVRELKKKMQAASLKGYTGTSSRKKVKNSTRKMKKTFSQRDGGEGGDIELPTPVANPAAAVAEDHHEDTV